MQTAMDGDQPAAEESTRPADVAAVPNPAASARGDVFYWLVIGTGIAGLLVAIALVVAAGSVSRPAAQTIAAPTARPARSAHSASPVTVEPTLLPTWVGRRQAVWGPDGTKTITFTLDAITDVTAASRTRPQLVARCLSRTVDLYVVTGPLSFEPQTGTHTVRVRVDDEPEQSQQWQDSDGSREVFAPDAAALVDRLARAQRLRVGFTPFNAKPVTAEFILEGFGELAPLVARTCAKRSR